MSDTRRTAKEWAGIERDHEHTLNGICMTCIGFDEGGAEGKEQEPGLPSPCSPSVRPPTRRSGCSADAGVRAAEPCPPDGQTGVYHHLDEGSVLPTDGDVP